MNITAVKQSLDRQSKHKQLIFLQQEVYPYLTQAELTHIKSLQGNPVAQQQYITRLYISNNSFKERKSQHAKAN